MPYPSISGPLPYSVSPYKGQKKSLVRVLPTRRGTTTIAKTNRRKINKLKRNINLTRQYAHFNRVLTGVGMNVNLGTQIRPFAMISAPAAWNPVYFNPNEFSDRGRAVLRDIRYDFRLNYNDSVGPSECTVYLIKLLPYNAKSVTSAQGEDLVTWVSGRDYIDIGAGSENMLNRERYKVMKKWVFALGGHTYGTGTATTNVKDTYKHVRGRIRVNKAMGDGTVGWGAMANSDPNLACRYYLVAFTDYNHVGTTGPLISYQCLLTMTDH